MNRFEQMVANRETSTFSAPGEWDAYRTWSRTVAECQHCGKKAMDRAWLYGLNDIDGSGWWLTETDCGCTRKAS